MARSSPTAPGHLTRTNKYAYYTYSIQIVDTRKRLAIGSYDGIACSSDSGFRQYPSLEWFGAPDRKLKKPDHNEQNLQPGRLRSFCNVLHLYPNHLFEG